MSAQFWLGLAGLGFTFVVTVAGATFAVGRMFARQPGLIAEALRVHQSECGKARDAVRIHRDTCGNFTWATNRPPYDPQ